MSAHDLPNNVQPDRRRSGRHAPLSIPPSSPLAGKPMPMRQSSASMTDVSSSSPKIKRKSSTTSLYDDGNLASPRRTLSRRSSSQLLSSPKQSIRSPLMPQAETEQQPSITPASVAAEYFAKELALHGDELSSTKSVIILHDACYGHRYSRPKTSKNTLSMIVERPERLHAGILGISAAYVRLGERHAEGKAAPHPSRTPPRQIPFKILRSKRAIPIESTFVTNTHGTSWMSELKEMCTSAGQKLATTGKELTRPETTTKATALKTKPRLHEGDLYLCSESLDAFEGALGGVCDGVDAVFDESTGTGIKSAFVCVRPPGHHCSSDYPSGFCWLNNVHVGIEYATQTYGLTHAAIVDFDLHHGDGSQSITWDHNVKVAKMSQKVPQMMKTAIGYFSIHDINSYPCEEGDQEKVQNASVCLENAHGQSIWNVHLQPWKDEAEFWELYKTRYSVILDKVRSFLLARAAWLKSLPNMPTPKAAIFLSAGFDASEWESAGMQRHKVNVPTEFYARLTSDIVQLANEVGLGVDGRVVSVLEGGYSDRALTSGVLSHLSGLCHEPIANQAAAKEEEGRLAREMGLAMSRLALESIGVAPVAEDEQTVSSADQGVTYAKSWWHVDRLMELEQHSNPAQVESIARKVSRSSENPTYFTLTQSFTAKVVDPTKVRSTSGRYASSKSPSRAVTPPIPEVDWATATYELHKLLVPTDRETSSCKPEDLVDNKVRRARVSDVGVSVATKTTNVRQLRDRKGLTTVPSDGHSDAESTISKRSTSDASRRKTIAEFPSAVNTVEPSTRSRRTSVASNSTVSSNVAATSVMQRTKARGTTATAASRTLTMKKVRGKPASVATSARGGSAHIAPQPRATDVTPESMPALPDAVQSLTQGLESVSLQDESNSLPVGSGPGFAQAPTTADDVSVVIPNGLAKPGPRLKLTNKAAEEADRKKAARLQRMKMKKPVVKLAGVTQGKPTTVKKIEPASAKVERLSDDNDTQPDHFGEIKVEGPLTMRPADQIEPTTFSETYTSAGVKPEQVRAESEQSSAMTATIADSVPTETVPQSLAPADLVEKLESEAQQAQHTEKTPDQSAQHTTHLYHNFQLDHNVVAVPPSGGTIIGGESGSGHNELQWMQPNLDLVDAQGDRPSRPLSRKTNNGTKPANGQPSSTEQSQAQIMVQQPQNTTPASKAPGKVDGIGRALPVFTSDGHIPFQTVLQALPKDADSVEASTDLPATHQKTASKSDVWEGPYTP